MLRFLCHRAVGPKSVLFFLVFCGLLFLSLNWKLSYQVSKDYIVELQESSHRKASRKGPAKSFQDAHTPLKGR